MLGSIVALLLAGQVDPGAGPDRDARLTPPSGFHGSWRVLAADDAGRQATMRIDVQHSPGEREGTGSYALYQPFCDLVAERRITGDADCELIGQGGEAGVALRDGRLTISFAPTADGIEHRLVVRRSSAGLTGVYRVADHRRAVWLERVAE
ncbi:hypothetical protein [Sphingomonas sp.]|uniref:hypothetical protein n=1 Tax=Sphingomonas sp. TaxID=28214 RepID=UPI002DD64A69|nr:hypothetical protein [Sphingomonas sp.]